MTQPPIPAKHEHERVHHGITFNDPYEWIREKESAAVQAHLTAENAYTQARTEHLEDLRNTLFEEIRTRTRETDMSVPTRKDDWWYYSRIAAGQQYSSVYRTPVVADSWTPPDLNGPAPDGEELVLDSNVEAQGQGFYSLGGLDVSPVSDTIAYATDTTGDERYVLRLRTLSDGQQIDADIPDTLGDVFFDPSGQFVFYQTVDETWRPDRVWRHQLGTPVTEDVCVFHEADPKYWVSASLSRSHNYIFLSTLSKNTSTYWVLPGAEPEAEPHVVWPRVEGVEYHVEDYVRGGEHRFIIQHNRDREDFDLIDVAAEAPGLDDPNSSAVPVIADPTGMRIDGMSTFATHMAVSYRRGGFSRVGLLDIEQADDSEQAAGGHWPPMREIDLGEEISTTEVGENPDWEQPVLRINFTSFIHPNAVIDVDVRTGDTHVRKEKAVLGGYSASDYTQRLEWATAADGTRIPLSIVAKVGVDYPAPVLLYGYGSYEYSVDPSFSIARLSLLERGVVFAVAHVRGGGELGRHWYEQGRTLQKKNTFTDFVACAQHLVDTGITRPQEMVAMGGSAGGLLMGAITNLAPELFAGVVAAVPFVDPLTSILMPELPLTVMEWEEWGDPFHDPEVYAYMAEYAPYENVSEQAYPRILAFTGLNDTRVLYVEPAKWVARLRECGADAIFKIEMEAGHGGVSGRYEAWKETAFNYAWILDVLESANAQA